MGSSRSISLFCEEMTLPQHDPCTGGGHTETAGSVTHLVCGPLNTHPQSLKHQVFHQVSLHLPKPLVFPSVHVWICIWLETKSLLVSGLEVFCFRELIDPKPSQVRSHSITRAWKHSLSPAWHTLVFPHVLGFPPRFQESHHVKMPGLDSLAVVISLHLLNTSGLFPDQSAQALLSDKITAIDSVYPKFPGRQIHFSRINQLFSSFKLWGFFSCPAAILILWSFHTPPPAYLSRPLIFCS